MFGHYTFSYVPLVRTENNLLFMRIIRSDITHFVCNISSDTRHHIFVSNMCYYQMTFLHMYLFIYKTSNLRMENDSCKQQLPRQRLATTSQMFPVECQDEDGSTLDVEVLSPFSIGSLGQLALSPPEGISIGNIICRRII